MKRKPTDMGQNRTGIESCAAAMREGVQSSPELRPVRPGDQRLLAGFRESYLQAANAVGTVPVPTTFTGLAQSVMQKLTGKKPEVLLDKLGERLAFERSGTRLYDALLMKCDIRKDELPDLPIEEIRQFRDEEARHFMLVRDVIRGLGGDPTAATPCADLDGVAAKGLVQIVTDPRTTVLQSLHAVHIAELADHDGWQLLIELTADLGMDDVSTKFRQALDAETRHLQTMRELMATGTMAEAGAA